MSYFYDILIKVKSIKVHHAIKRDLEHLDVSTKRELAGLFDLLASGVNLGLPVSRPMPAITHGVHELRLKDRMGQLRIFYYTKHKDSILVFHMFRKKTQATPKTELRVAQKRLEDLI